MNVVLIIPWLIQKLAEWFGLRKKEKPDEKFIEDDSLDHLNENY